MATHIGSKLPTALFNKMRKKSSSDSNEVVFLISVDTDGYPNIALLSFSELHVKSVKLIIFAIGDGSSSKRNLLASKRGELVFWGGKGSGMYYIKGGIKLLKPLMDSSVEGFRCSVLIFRVEKVSKDYLPIARILSTVTYDNKRSREGHHKLHEELMNISRLN